MPKTDILSFFKKQSSNMLSKEDIKWLKCTQYMECCDRCLDFSCYQAKVEEYLARQKRRVKKIPREVEKKIMLQCIDENCLDYCIEEGCDKK